MMGWVSRFRHGRGFGVHSPFAFKFITEVLRETLPYYDWHRVKGKHERLLYRIACRFRPAAVSAPAPLAAIVAMAEPNATPATPDKADLVVVDTDADVAVAADALRRGAVLFVCGNRHKRLMEQLLPTLAELCHGMVFDNESDTAIVVAFPRLPFQVFNARF